MYNPYMALAIQQAEAALEQQEVPVGAVITKDSRVIAAAHNLREINHSATAHAEILAIEQACGVIGDWRLDGCSLYVTLEPCLMCAGAILNARISSVYFGAFDKIAGAMGTAFDCTRLPNLKSPAVYAGIMEEQCNKLMESFFQRLRDGST